MRQRAANAAYFENDDVMNPILFQFFHWYYSPEGNLWLHAVQEASHLATLGVTHVWLPPAYKSADGVNEAGYAVYDLYDLGAFDQKGAVRTRYGTADEYHKAIAAFHQAGIRVLADIVLNHRTGADETEKVTAQKVNPANRNEKTSDPFLLDAYTRFTFPGRKGKYSRFIWDQRCFSGVCLNDEIFIIRNEYTNGEWDEVPEKENGNFDFLLGCDIEFRNPHVRQELKKWGRWYVNHTGVDGIRLDGIKHIPTYFLPEWLKYLFSCVKKDLFVIGEYWKNDTGHLLDYIGHTDGMIRLFDVPLHFNFFNAALAGASYDLRKIFDNTLVSQKPDLSITFADNHDTQPLQSLESYVDYWFKPLAYALILLREKGIPCVFYPVIYEAKYAGNRGDEEVFIELNRIDSVVMMMKVRKELAYGVQQDYWDHPNVIGWTRAGIPEKEFSGCVVLISNHEGGEKIMSPGLHHSGRSFVDVTGSQPPVLLNEKGEGRFTVGQRSVSVWIDERAKSKL